MVKGCQFAFPGRSTRVEWVLSQVIGLMFAYFFFLTFIIGGTYSAITTAIVAICLWGLFTIGSYCILFNLALPTLAKRGFSKRFIGYSFLLAMVTGLFLYFVIPLEHLQIPKSSIWRINLGGFLVTTAPVIYPVVSTVFLGTVLFLIFAFFARPAGLFQSRNIAKKNIILYALPMILVWGFFLVLFWPGIMTTDSIDQWQQLLTGNYNDAHPAFHTWTMWLITRLTLTPAAVAVAQILLLAIVSACAFYQMRRFGTPQYLVLIAVFLYSISIPNIFLSITLWKDVMFTISAIFLFILWFEIMISAGEWLKHLSHALLLATALLLVCLFRHNGLPAVLFALAGLLAFGKSIRLKVVFASGLFLLAYFLIKGPVYHFAKVGSTGSNFEVGTEVFQIASHLSQGTGFSQGELHILNAIRPVQDHWSYNCYSSVQIIFSNKFKILTAYHYAPELRKIFLDTLIRNPIVNLKHTKCSSSLVWMIDSNHYPLHTIGLFYGSTRIETIYPNNFGIRNKYVLPKLTNDIGIKILSIPTNKALNIIVWSPALYFYIFIFGVILTAIRTCKVDHLLLLAPVLGIALSIALVNGSQDFRYMYPVYAISLLYWPFLYNRHWNEK